MRQLGVAPDAEPAWMADGKGMGSQYTIAWSDSTGIRRVGRLVVNGRGVTLEGTETTAPRRHATVYSDLDSVTGASVVRNGELPAVRIETAEGPLVVELVTGGRGAALALVDELSARAA